MIHKEQSYKIIAPDGREYGPVDAETIKCWYLEDRINKEAMVLSIEHNLWMRLAQAFNVQDWERHKEAPLAIQSPSLPPPPSLDRPSQEAENQSSEFIANTPSIQQQRPGLKLAAWLILIEGIVGYIFQLTEIADSRKTGAPSIVWTPSTAATGLIFSIFIFIGLIRQNGFLKTKREGWRKTAIFRIVLGIAFYCIFIPLSERTATGYIGAGITLIESLAILALLAGPPPSRLRIRLSIAALVLVVVSPFLVPIISALVAGQEQIRKIRSAALPNREFADDKSGVKLVLPEGWVMLPKDNPYFNPPGANVILANPETDIFAALLIEPISVRLLPGGSTPTDRYFNLVITNRRKSIPSLEEVSRTPLELGHRAGLRMITRWTEKELKLTGMSTACHEGFYFYLITGFCETGNLARGLSAFQSLEQNLSITKDEEAQIDDLAQGVVKDMPFYTVSTAKLLLRELPARGLDASQAGQFGFDVMQKGTVLLSYDEQIELQSIRERALAGLTDAEMEKYRQAQEKMRQRMGLSVDEGGAAAKILKQAFESLPENDLARFRTLSSKAMRLGLKAH
jgi:hypothetical protein